MTSRIVGLMWLCLLVVGCSSIQKKLTDPSYLGPFRNHFNYSGVDADILRSLKRVAVLPTARPEDGAAQSAADAAVQLQLGLLEELRQSVPFESVVYKSSPARMLQGYQELRTTDALPSNLLQEIQRQTDADAMLFSSVTAFSPYPPLLIGVKLTLVRVHDGTILWQFDDAMNAGDPPTLNDARRFLREKLGVETDPPPALSMDSPQRFTRYAAAIAVKMLRRSIFPQQDPPTVGPTLKDGTNSPAARQNFPQKKS